MEQQRLRKELGEVSRALVDLAFKTRELQSSCTEAESFPAPPGATRAPSGATLVAFGHHESRIICSLAESPTKLESLAARLAINDTKIKNLIQSLRERGVVRRGGAGWEIVNGEFTLLAQAILAGRPEGDEID
jgi:biotin operon repressor